MQKGPVDPTECSAADERQMTSAADSLYVAVRRAQTVTTQAMASLPARLPSSCRSKTSLMLFVIRVLTPNTPRFTCDLKIHLSLAQWYLKFSTDEVLHLVSPYSMCPTK